MRNNGLREAVVTVVVFVFEHFFYSSAKLILMDVVLGCQQQKRLYLLKLCITFIFAACLKSIRGLTIKKNCSILLVSKLQK